LLHLQTLVVFRGDILHGRSPRRGSTATATATTGGPARGRRGIRRNPKLGVQTVKLLLFLTNEIVERILVNAKWILFHLFTRVVNEQPILFRTSFSS
jgi:hypothetical protein